MENSKKDSQVGTLLVQGWRPGWSEMKLERCAVMLGGRSERALFGSGEQLKFSSEQGDYCWRILARE